MPPETAKRARYISRCLFSGVGLKQFGEVIGDFIQNLSREFWISDKEAVFSKLVVHGERVAFVREIDPRFRYVVGRETD
jgi:hypothetical protein